MQALLPTKMLKKLSTPNYTSETSEEYKKMSKAQQDQIKDVGGFVGGVLKDGIRSATTVVVRSLLTLDVDNASLTFLDEYLDCSMHPDKVREELGMAFQA